MRNWKLAFVVKDARKTDLIVKAVIHISDAVMFGSSEKIIKTLAKFKNLPLRLICAPPTNIKSAQNKVKEELNNIPIHPRAYGFVSGRSPFDCAQAHILYHGKMDRGLTVLNIDIQDFFHSIREDVVIKSLNAHGVAASSIDNILNVSCLKVQPDLALKAVEALIRCTTQAMYISPSFRAIRYQSLTAGNMNQDSRVLPHMIDHVIEVFRQRLNGTIAVRGKHHLLENPSQVIEAVGKYLLGIDSKVGGRFLPQGSPSSPVISNICMKIIDIRLTAMAKAFGAFYTRYADDLSFSWPYRQSGKTVDGLKRCAILVLKEYNLFPNKKKIKVMGPGSAQDIVGYNVNSGVPTVPSSYRQSLKLSVKAARESNESVSDKEINSLMGRAGYLSLAHPAQSEKLKASIKMCIDKPIYQRGVVIINHDESSHTESGGVFTRNFSTP